MTTMIVYKEIQQMRQWWLWVILMVVAAVPIWRYMQLLDSGQTYGEALFSLDFLMVMAVPVLVLLLFVLIKLTTEVGAEGIKIRYFPLWGTRISWDEVQTAEVIQYGFVGYGIRLSFRHGMVYNTSGNMGLQIVKKNGNKILIGTQRPDELQTVVENFVTNKGL